MKSNMFWKTFFELKAKEILPYLLVFISIFALSGIFCLFVYLIDEKTEIQPEHILAVIIGISILGALFGIGCLIKYNIKITKRILEVRKSGHKFKIKWAEPLNYK